MLRRLALAVSLLVALSLGAMAWIHVATQGGPRPAAASAAAPGPAVPVAAQATPIVLAAPAPATAFAPPAEPAGMEPEEPALPRYQDSGATVLMLQVETAPGRATIVDAPLEARGPASDGTIACAQRVLRGRTVRTPGGDPPARHRLLFNLHP